MNEPLLCVEGAWKRFGGFTALSGVSLSVLAGEVRAVIGPNGAGKSTLFNIIAGQERCDEGSIQFRGARIDRASPARRAQRGLGRTFQIPAAFRSLTARENVEVALQARRGDAQRLWRSPASTDAADALLKSVGIAGVAGERCGDLSLSDIKRIEIALALATDPVLLLLDEPCAGMARAERQGLLSLLRDLIHLRKLTVVFIEHDIDVVFQFATRISVLHRGTLVAEGDAAEVRSDPVVREIYLGEEE